MIQGSRVVYLKRPREATFWGAQKAKLGRLCFYHQTMLGLFKLLQVMRNQWVCLPSQITHHRDAPLSFFLYILCQRIRHLCS